MRNYKAICVKGDTTDVLNFEWLKDFKGKLGELMEIYDVITIRQNGNFITRYVKSETYGILKQVPFNMGKLDGEV